MARLTRNAVGVPDDLRTYVPKRWIQEILQDPSRHCHSRLKALPRDERFKDTFAIVIYAPALYRDALWAAVGERDGERHYQEEMSSQRVQKMKVAAIARSLAAQHTETRI
jgi:hypothetical protein